MTEVVETGAEVNNPLLLIDPVAQQKYKADYAGLPSAVIATKKAELDKEFMKITEQMGAECDLMKVDGDLLNGKDPQERLGSFIQIHTRAATCNDEFLRSQQVEQVVKSAIKKAETSGLHIDDIPGMPSEFGENGLYSRMQATAEEEGWDIKEPNFKYSGEMSGRNDPLFQAVFRTAAGWTPFVNRQPGFVPDAQRPVQIMDYLPAIMAMENAVKYMEETVFNNHAVETREAAQTAGRTTAADPSTASGAFKESELRLVERDVPIQSVGTHIPMTREQLADEGQAEGYVNMRLPFMVRQRIDSQLMVGNGTAPNLRGFLNTAGIQNYDLKLEGTAWKEVLKDLLRIKVNNIMVTGRASASMCVLHPAAWVEVALQETQSAGFYLGSPREEFTPRIWGLPIVLAEPGLAAGTTDDDIVGLMGDFAMYSYIAVRKDISVESGFIDTDFIQRLHRLMAWCRLALVVLRPAAFCKITYNTG